MWTNLSIGRPAPSKIVYKTNLVQKNFVPKKIVYKIKAPKIFGQKSLVKMGSITAEILLICTNVARACVAWTNVIMTDCLC